MPTACAILILQVNRCCRGFYTGYDLLMPRKRSLNEAKLNHAALGIIYFLHAAEVNRIKIGFTTGLSERVKRIETMSPCKVEVLTWVHSDFHTECILHGIFAKHRHHGEWFHAAESLLKFIAKLPRGETFLAEEIVLAKDETGP